MQFGALTNPLAGLFGAPGQGLFPPTGPQTLFPTTGLQNLFPTTGLQTLFPTTDLSSLLNVGAQSFFPTTSFPSTTFPSSFGNLQCFTGRVNILNFIRPSNIVATLTTLGGQTILLTTNNATIRAQLVQVDNRFATICGNFVIRDGQLALNVQVVIPQQITPNINLQQLLLLLLLILLIRGRLSFSTLGATGLGSLVNQLGGQAGLQQALNQFGGVTGVTNLVNQLGGEAAIASQLQQAGISI